VEEAQLCIENAAKAVISCFQIPSWSHNPSDELHEVIAENRSKILHFADSALIQRLEALAEAAHLVAPEHGRASYGDIRARIPPSVSTQRRTAGMLSNELKKHSPHLGNSSKHGIVEFTGSPYRS